MFYQRLSLYDRDNSWEEKISTTREGKKEQKQQYSHTDTPTHEKACKYIYAHKHDNQTNQQQKQSKKATQRKTEKQLNNLWQNGFRSVSKG